MKPYLLICIIVGLNACNTNKLERVTDSMDYDKYLKISPVETTSKYFNLWDSKIQQDSLQLMSLGIVAGEYSRYFQGTGEIQYLKKAERSLDKAVEVAAIGKAGFYRALARNYISQHRFKEALTLAEMARKKGSGVPESQNLLFDVHMELGNYDQAKSYLDSISNSSDFGYLIRMAKWMDHKGDLEYAISLMEKAKVKAEHLKSKELRLWSYTNLADYYGHAGRIEDSYSLYLRALEIDPQNAYAKKGIAWIVFSYEKNPREALRILDSVTQNYMAPDYYLLKSEIANYMGDEMESFAQLDQYFNAVKNPAYGDMYNAYNVPIYLERTEQFGKALEIAEREVQNRPTPHSYDLLAYAYFKTGNKAKALDIINDHIAGKTYEPSIQFHMAEIYKAMGQEEQVKVLKKELLSAGYELGPEMEHKIYAL